MRISCAAIPNNDFYEQLVLFDRPHPVLALGAELPIVDGFITVPNAPGMGLDLDWATLEKTALAIV